MIKTCLLRQKRYQFFISFSNSSSFSAHQFYMSYVVLVCFDIYEVLMTINVARARRGCDSMVVQVTTTNEISVYHH